MAYKAGSLEIELLGIDTNAVKSIQDTAKALNILSNAFKRIEQTQIVLVGQKLEHIFTKIASATKSIDTTNLTALASAGKSLSAISRIGNLEKVDFAKVGKGFENLSVAITPFLEKVKSAEASLTALYGTLSKASGKKIQGLLGGDTATPKGKKGGAFSFLNIAKWTAVFAVARRFGRVLGNIVQSGADYTETLNLWETAMGSNLNVATEFVNKMNEAYGISEKTLMNAQAIFKNMLGSLGQISDTMAYSLSEGITQMALDYASLYNQTFEKAFQKFQAALAGQVRPIRSVAGYDITENTLYQLYQSLGGTKTMRQLTRTEKQLLSILAIFNQMTASGAVGDLDKTMSSFANQSRVWKESLVEVKNWLGVILTYTIQESGIMIKLNAMLITVARYLEAVAKQIGAIQHFENDPFANMEQNAIDTNKAVDELQGKLLDFDKFRSLSGAEENALGLDEKLLNAMSGYDTILGNARNKARELSDQWLKAWGFTINANGELELTNEQLETAKEKIDSIINFLKGFDGKGTLEAITPLMSTALTILKELLPIITTLSQTMLPITLRIVEIIGGLVKTLDTLGLLDDVLIVILSYKIATKLMAVANNIKILIQPLSNLFTIIMTQGKTAIENWILYLMEAIGKGNTFKLAVWNMSGALIGLSASALGAFALIQNWGDMSTWQKIIGIIGVATTAILGLAMAFGAFHSAWSLGLATVGIVAGIGAIVASIATVKKEVAVPVEYYADGGLPDKGTLFYANEAGAEIVYNTPSGQSGVVNIQQIKMAFLGALQDWTKSYLDRELEEIAAISGGASFSSAAVYSTVKKEAKRRGETFAKV